MNLLGDWVIDPTDDLALRDLGDVLLSFKGDGQLLYVVRSPSKKQQIKLRYKIDGSDILTDQPSAPRLERTQFSISQDGILTLEFGGVPYRFRRQDEQGKLAR